MGLKQRIRRSVRSVLGTNEILSLLDVLEAKAQAPPPTPVGGVAGLDFPGGAAIRINALLERIVTCSRSGDQQSLGFDPAQMPVLIELNGDLLWLPGDLLRFLWHTRVDGARSLVPRFLAETPHYDWIRRRLRPGDAVLDVGANLGLFATMMAAMVTPAGQVHCFEPSPGAHADLLRMLSLNDLDWVRSVPLAAADKAGEALFCDVREGDVRRESSHLEELGRAEMLGAVQKHRVRVGTIALDDYVREHSLKPALIKIDAVGAEFLVLEGAAKTLEHKPRLVIEVYPDEHGQFDHKRLKRYLSPRGYNVFFEDKIYYCD